MSERDEWLKDRKYGIGASDAASVIGCSPYKTNVQLWEEKVGIREPEDISEKDYVKYGNDAEEPLRQLFVLDYPQYKVEHNQFKMIRHPELPFIFATLDGELTDRASASKGVLEVKKFDVTSSVQSLKWKGENVPQNYYIQVIHQLLATGWNFVIINAYLRFLYGKHIEAKTIRRDIQRKDVLDDIEYLKEREVKFWDCVQRKVKPPLILPEI